MLKKKVSKKFRQYLDNTVTCGCKFFSCNLQITRARNGKKSFSIFRTPVIGKETKSISADNLRLLTDLVSDPKQNRTCLSSTITELEIICPKGDDGKFGVVHNYAENGNDY